MCVTNPRLLVNRLLAHGTAEAMIKGELCINERVIQLKNGVTAVAFEEYVTFIQAMGLHIVSLSPRYAANPGQLPEFPACKWPHLNRWVNDTSLFTCAVIDGAFESGMRTLGLEPFCLMLRKPLPLREWIHRVETLNKSLINYLASQGINGIILADDIAHSGGLFASPQIIKDLFIPSLARQVEYGLSLGVPVFFHSDGNYMAVIEEIIAAGFTGLQCLEKTAGMDIRGIRQQFGRDLCLWGHLDAGDIEQAANEESLKSVIQETQELAAGGRFILGTASGLFEGMDVDTLQKIYRRL